MRPLSTTASDASGRDKPPVTTRQNRVSVRRIVLTLVCAALALVVCDPLVGAWAKANLDEPALLTNDFPSTWGLDLFWRLTSSGQQPIVFTGSSTVYTGVSPHIFDDKVKELTGTSSFSLIVGASGEIASWARDLIKNIFIPRHASVIFYATEMRAYAERNSDASWQQSSLGYNMQFPPGLRKEIALWLLEHSALIQYRDNFHDLIMGKRTVRGQFGNYNFLDDRGYSASYGQHDPNEPMNVPNDWTPLMIEPAQQSALAEIAQLCKASNTPCIFVIMPVDDSLFKVIPEAERQQFQRFVKDQTIQNQGKTFIWDFNTEACITALGERPFIDRDHLNVAGAAKLSTMLAILYAHEFYGQAIPPNSNVECADQP
jgi:hypothetical protein